MTFSFNLSGFRLRNVDQWSKLISGRHIWTYLSWEIPHLPGCGRSAAISAVEGSRQCAKALGAVTPRGLHQQTSLGGLTLQPFFSNQWFCGPGFACQWKDLSWFTEAKLLTPCKLNDWGWFIPRFWGFSIIGHDIIPKIIHYWGWIIHYFPFIPLFLGIFHYIIMISRASPMGEPSASATRL